MGLARSCPGGCKSQTAEDTLAHLGGGLVCEGQCNNLFRVIDLGQQGQKALGEKFCLASTGRGFNDEGAPGVYGGFTVLCIDLEQV